MSPRLVEVSDMEPPFVMCANLVEDRLPGGEVLRYLEMGTPTLCPAGRHTVDNVTYGWGGAVAETQDGTVAFIGLRRIWVEGDAS